MFTIKYEDHLSIHEKAFQAVKHNDYCMLYKLIKGGLDLTIVNEELLSLLHYAAKNDRRQCLTELADAGVNLDLQDTKGRTAIFLATEYDNSEIIFTLVDLGANPAIPDHHGVTPLHIAAYKGYDSIVERMLYYYKTLNICAMANDEGVTVLHAAIMGKSCSNPIMAEHLRVVALLVTHSAALINLPTKDGRTPLYIAAAEGHVDILDFLIERGAQVDSADNNGITPLLMAATNGHLKVLKTLQKHGADINASMIIGITPLYSAAAIGFSSIVAYLLEQKDIQLRPLICHYDALKQLAEYNPKISSKIEDLLRDKSNEHPLYTVTPQDIAAIFERKYVIAVFERWATEQAQLNRLLSKPAAVREVQEDTGRTSTAVYGFVVDGSSCTVSLLQFATVVELGKKSNEDCQVTQSLKNTASSTPKAEASLSKTPRYNHGLFRRPETKKEHLFKALELVVSGQKNVTITPM